MKGRFFRRRLVFVAAELEGEFAELGGWEAESEASTTFTKLEYSRRTSLPKYE